MNDENPLVVAYLFSITLNIIDLNGAILHAENVHKLRRGRNACTSRKRRAEKGASLSNDFHNGDLTVSPHSDNFLLSQYYYYNGSGYELYVYVFSYDRARRALSSRQLSMPTPRGVRFADTDHLVVMTEDTIQYWRFTNDTLLWEVPMNYPHNFGSIVMVTPLTFIHVFEREIVRGEEDYQRKICFRQYSLPSTEATITYNIEEDYKFWSTFRKGVAVFTAGRMNLYTFPYPGVRSSFPRFDAVGYQIATKKFCYFTNTDVVIYEGERQVKKYSNVFADGSELLACVYHESTDTVVALSQGETNPDVTIHVLRDPGLVTLESVKAFQRESALGDPALARMVSKFTPGFQREPQGQTDTFSQRANDDTVRRNVSFDLRQSPLRSED